MKSLDDVISGIHTLQINLPRHRHNHDVYNLLRTTYTGHLYDLAVYQAWPAYRAAVLWYASHLREELS